MMLEFVCQPELDQRLAGNAKAGRFSVERLHHPRGKIHINTPRLKTGTAHFFQIQQCRYVLTLIRRRR
jgi:hypothetical protein